LVLRSRPIPRQKQEITTTEQKDCSPPAREVVLSIGTIAPLTQAFLPDALARFRELFPLFEVRLGRCPSSKMVEDAAPQGGKAPDLKADVQIAATQVSFLIGQSFWPR
jgi:DNA-binding transcriptional LysR family regulator